LEQEAPLSFLSFLEEIGIFSDLGGFAKGVKFRDLLSGYQLLKDFVLFSCVTYQFDPHVKHLVLANILTRIA
jgi:hypothetical protein